MTSIIQSNRERKSRLDEGLVERLNDIKEKITDSPIPTKVPRPGMTFSIDEHTLIFTRNQEEYDTLMQICEYALIPWQDGDAATDKNYFVHNKHNTCIDFTGMKLNLKEQFYRNSTFYNSYKIYGNVYEFVIEKGLQFKLSELYNWFDTNKPERASKG